MYTTTITTTNPQGYTQIFRKDTQQYTEQDVYKEILEWERILEEQTCMEPNYLIRRIEFSSRMTSTLAKTGRQRNSRLGYIVINLNYMKTHSNPDNFHSTLAHEVVHSFPECFNHGPQFKAVGRLLSNTVPSVTIARTGSDAGYTAYKKHLQKTRNPRTIWIAKCVGCGQEIIRERRIGIIKEPHKYKCGKCGGKFKVEEHRPDGTIRQWQTLTI